MNHALPLQIAPLRPADRTGWEPLARGYKAFYETPTGDDEYEAAWQRLMARRDALGLGAHHEGRLVGIAHYLFHTSTWAARVCYLQDLFVAPGLRGRGVARALILAVRDEAHAQGCARYYWNTQEHNSTARRLYDKVAQFNGFIRYELPL